ncbi:MAG: cytochrome b5 domain-containing protein [Elusimicrobia bacterium]|nr:cytochrome b5 domain-containing protein [Elusimicrobiota bacterium]
MKRFILAAFISFLSSAATIGLLGRLAPPDRPAAAAERRVSAAELARHAAAEDCWLAVEGGVYDVTAYVPAHPAPRRALTDWCGKEATRAFLTKGVGRPHGEEARALLETLRVGALR